MPPHTGFGWLLVIVGFIGLFGGLIGWRGSLALLTLFGLTLWFVIWLLRLPFRFFGPKGNRMYHSLLLLAVITCASLTACASKPPPLPEAHGPWVPLYAGDHAPGEMEALPPND